MERGAREVAAGDDTKVLGFMSRERGNDVHEFFESLLDLA
jgi:hypothetical protein